jgi:hypothetical protein
MANTKRYSEKATPKGRGTFPEGCLTILRQLICGTKESAPPSGQPLVVPPPVPQRWRMALGVATAPFADPARTEVMLSGLSKLLARQRASVRFSRYTGLVRSLRGEIYPERKAASAGDLLAISEEFLFQHEAALLGAEGYQWRADSQPIIGSCARFRQMDQNDIPLYGATMSFGFDNDGHLSMVNNSWYPISPEVDYEQSFKLTWDQASEIALQHVVSYFLPKAQSQSTGPTETPPLAGTLFPAKDDWDLEVIPGDDLKEGRVIFPQLDGDKEAAEDLYRPAWVALVIDRAKSRSYEVAVDAENGQVLAATDATVRMPRAGCVYLSNGDTEAHPVQFPFDKWHDAPHFEMRERDASSISSPPLPPSPPCGSVNPTHNGFRAGNVYHHLSRALDIFIKTVDKAWSVVPGDVPTMPGEKEDDKVLVNMILEEGDAWYDPAPPRSISFCTGLPTDDPPVDDTDDPPVDDVARDCEVVYHEYAHAVLHVVQPDLFRNLPYLFRQAINEGLAFYFGCTLSERPHPGQPDTADAQPYRWGEFAYGDSVWDGFRDLHREDPNDQEAEYDYLPVYGVFPSYSEGCKDPVKDGKEYYACGVLWARALWDIRQALGYDIADAIILRGLSLAGGVQSELETPAEAIIHADGEYAKEGPSHESALRLIFCSRGIMADAPVHDMTEVKLGAKTYVLAATENTEKNNPQPGCMLSDNKGDSWAPLGTDGPLEVVALAAVKVSEAKAIIWAASEHRAEDGDNVVPTAKVYRYELKLDSANGTINADDSWSELGQLSEKHSVLSLAAARTPGGAGEECCLFAGTERGLYKYDGSWAQVSSVPGRRQVFDLAVTGTTGSNQPVPRLLVATHKYLYVLDLASLTWDSKLGVDYVLTVTADDDQGHLWAGTAFQGIYHFDPSDGQWQQDSTIDNRPVYSLLVEQEGTERVFYAGTNNGVYRRVGSGDWEEFNTASDPGAEAIGGTSVVTLCRVHADDTADRLLAGTAQRGLWGRTTQWVRLTNGLPRIGRLLDAIAFPDPCNWSHEFAENLPEHGVGTHVFYVPGSDCNSLSIKRNAGNIKDPVLYYVSPYTNTLKHLWAGLQHRQLTQNGTTWTMEAKVQEGFYVLAVTGRDGDTSYRVAVQTF